MKYYWFNLNKRQINHAALIMFREKLTDKLNWYLNKLNDCLYWVRKANTTCLQPLYKLANFRNM